ncbi:MAG: hypothetical protein JWN04_4654 [Myxococcaceae bacterium]|nr:hypothetical protein [Myxococcaceae bacterium]
MGNFVAACRTFGLGLFIVCSASCSDGASKSAGLSLPLVTPPVRAATPIALGGGGAAAGANGLAPKLQALDSGDLKQRFFTAGPTNLFQILGDLDARIGDINARTGNHAACLTQEPVAYTLTPFGEPALTFYAQCYQTTPRPGASTPSFFQFGQRDGVTYLFSSSGAERVAARLIPAAGTTLYSIDGGPAVGTGNTSDGGAAAPGQYRVDVWIGVGYDNASACGRMNGFDDCSYGAITLHADESRAHFELSVAGLGFGYCGAQLTSDGTRIYAIGSLDMGTTCLPTDTACVAASDLTSPAVCTGLSPDAAHALGRRATTGPNGSFGASEYPGPTSNQIVLDGTPTDSLGFGPSAPTPGAGDFGVSKT